MAHLKLIFHAWQLKSQKRILKCDFRNSFFDVYFSDIFGQNKKQIFLFEAKKIFIMLFFFVCLLEQTFFFGNKKKYIFEEKLYSMLIFCHLISLMLLQLANVYRPEVFFELFF